MTPSEMNELAEKEYPIKSWMDVSTQIEVKNERAAFIHGLQHSSGQVKEDWISVETELIKVQDDYIHFLDKESSPFVQFASIHGMEVSRSVFEKGQSYRTRISLLKSKLPNPPANQTLTKEGEE